MLTDFDGTITTSDVAEDLLRAFAPAEWWDLERLHRARKLGTRETMIRQFAMVRATEAQLLEFVDKHANLDPTFPEFARFCENAELRLEIVSEGLEFYVAFLLRKWGFNIPYRTNRSHSTPAGMRIEYPWADATCTLCGTCKLGRLFELRVAGYRIAYVGDGTSDICPAIEADLVFAKDELARLCLEEDIAFIPFERFSDVQRRIEGWP